MINVDPHGLIGAYAADDALIAASATGASHPAVIDAEHLSRQREWSARTFGPAKRTKGVLDHIRKELKEIEDDPTDLGEWVDVVILALDGAWRHGAEPQQIIDAIVAKQARNEARTWPDWRGASEDQDIEHDRSRDPAVPRLSDPCRDGRCLMCGGCLGCLCPPVRQPKHEPVMRPSWQVRPPAPEDLWGPFGRRAGWVLTAMLLPFALTLLGVALCS